MSKQFTHYLYMSIILTVIVLTYIVVKNVTIIHIIKINLTFFSSLQTNFKMLNEKIISKC